MNALETKQAIQSALSEFASKPLAEAATALLEVLGYQSQKRTVLKPNTADNFVESFADKRQFNKEQALIADWQSIDILFQLTDEEIRTSTPEQLLLFESHGQWDGKIIESYLFFAITLKRPTYTRTELAGITRTVNRLFSMPVMLLFRHGDALTLSVINRRLHKRAPDKDVLEKVTLIKDIEFADPLRAHVEILYDLSLTALHDEFEFHNFVGLHQAWEKRLASYALNERFYREIANWYFWAITSKHVALPRSIQAIRNKGERDKQRAIFFIRLLTRLIFCWFLQEKRLIPRDLFRPRVVQELLRDDSPKAGTFYRAALQNLFFATLNQEQENRGWRKKYKGKGARDGNRGVTSLWRYQDLLTDPDRLEALLRDHIPFVNGGLFDCLDDVRDQKDRPNIRLDDFSEEKDNPLCLPNELFFGDEREVDLSEVYDDQRRRREKVRGLIEILSRYKFTVEENTPLEEEIALDPELLGKVFENLLAAYNEDTRTTARKALGAFYTPREIVHYMVDESLRSYLAEQVPSVPLETLEKLFAPRTAMPKLTNAKKEALIAAIGRVKVLDPACGSGAFPMGALHRLVDLLQKLDPNNEGWKRKWLQVAKDNVELLRTTNTPKEQVQEAEDRIVDIEKSFDTTHHALDFARKLYLIENCIYGVDIQPIACQIAKLRFFIALIVDQHVNRDAPNLGVRPLPNLETKVVAADSLIPIEKPSGQMNLFDEQLRPLRRQLEQVRHDHFSARTPARKAKCRDRDAVLREKIADTIEQAGMPTESAHKLSAWDPYDQNHAAPFFDSEWMFGIPVGRVRVEGKGQATLLGNFSFVNDLAGQMEFVESGEVDSGFDIVIGNPPYVRLQTLKQQSPELVAFYKEHYKSAKKGNYDLYVVFVEAGLTFLKPSGHLAYILPHKFFNAQYGQPLRELLAKGRHLQHVVHFGDQQVFPGATNYVCLLFLAKSGTEACRFVRADDLKTWLNTFRGTEGEFADKSIGSSAWNFSVGRGSALFGRLAARDGAYRALGDVADIFVGLQTSADDVFILNFVGRTSVGFRLWSKALDREIELENTLLRPVVSGTDVRTYDPLPHRQYLLFPYKVKAEKASLIPFAEIQRTCPDTANYLITNRSRLEGREDGKFADCDWYRFGRSQNLGIQDRNKVCVPRLVDMLHAGLDLEGSHYLDNVDVGGVTWRSNNASRSLQLLAAFLNSAVLRWFFPHVSAPFRGGFRSANRQFISLLPIAEAAPEQEHEVVRLVDYLLWLNRHVPAHNDETRRDETRRDETRRDETRLRAIG